MSVTIRPATAEDFARWGDPTPPYRVRAWVGEKDGEILGIGGVAYPPGSLPVAWVNFTPDAYRYPKTMHQTALRFLAAIDHPRIILSADNSIGASRRWAERLGFRPTGLHTEDGEVFIHDRHCHADQPEPAT